MIWRWEYATVLVVNNMYESKHRIWNFCHVCRKIGGTKINANASKVQSYYIALCVKSSCQYEAVATMSDPAIFLHFVYVEYFVCVFVFFFQNESLCRYHSKVLSQHISLYFVFITLNILALVFRFITVFKRSCFYLEYVPCAQTRWYSTEHLALSTLFTSLQHNTSMLHCWLSNLSCLV